MHSIDRDRGKKTCHRVSTVYHHNAEEIPISNTYTLPIALRHPLQLVLLLDGIRVAASLCGVDELLGEALGDALDVAERGLARADGQEGDGLIDPAQWGHVDGLATDGASGADARAVFAGPAVDDCVDGDLQGVRVACDVDLAGRVAC